MRFRIIGAAVAATSFIAAFAFGYARPAASPPPGFDDANRGRPLAPLGSDAQCARYAGLPANWRDDPKAGMVHLRGGAFVFGSTRGYPDERPAGDGRTRVGGFWIDQTDVTIAQFAAFVQATGYVTDAERQGGAAVFHVPTRDEMNARDLAWWSWVRGAS